MSVAFCQNLCRETDRDLLCNLVSQIASRGARLEKKVNKASSKHSKRWARERKTLISKVCSKMMMFYINTEVL